MDFLPLIIIIVYLVVTTAIGSMLARKATTSRQWTVAGGGMGVVMVAVGIAGTRIGGASTYGVAGNVIGGGMWYAWWYGINTFLALAIVGAFFAVPYRRLELQTVGEIFTLRFDSRRNQVLTSLCVQTEYFIVNLIEAYVIGTILRALTGMPMEYAVFIAAIILITYTSLGGLWGTAVTNLIHCAVIFFGLLIIGVAGIYHLDGWDATVDRVNAHLASAGKNETQWWSFFGGGFGAILGMFFSAAIHTPAASIYTNFSTAAKSQKVILPAFLLGGFIGGLMPILAGLIGMETLARYGFDVGLSGYTNITQLPTEISPFIGGLALAAILAAVISSGGPILLSSSTMFVRDWLPFTRDYTPTGKLLAYRITTVVYGLIAAVMAYITALTAISLLDLLLFGFAMVVPPAIAAGYLIYWRRTTEPAAYWGMVLGYTGGLIWYAIIRYAVGIGFTVEEGAPFGERLFHYLFVNRGKGIDPSYITTLIPLISIPIISLLTREDLERKDAFYAVVRGEKERSALGA